MRDTLFTELNVFETFDPVIPERFRKANFVILGNIDPVLQIKVLDQMEKPQFVVCDMINYWIEGKKDYPSARHWQEYGANLATVFYEYFAAIKL